MRAWLAALLLAAAPAWAAPFAVPVGKARIGLEAPAGFADTGFTGSPRLREIAESLTSASNRILLFAVSDGDLRSFMQGDRPELRRFMIAVTPRALEDQNVTTRQFDAFVGDALRGFGAPPPQGDMLKYLDAQPRGKAALLGELRRDTTVVSVLQGTRLPDRAGFGAKPEYLLSTTTLLNLRGKALSLAVYSSYESAEDLGWIRLVTARWIEDLERLNAR
ncbi:MAG TPA: hypothetical protein VKA16_01985 [Burkholderiales bacterium]|nr:hypothetical protein [Burkholderiales bacterium]